VLGGESKSGIPGLVFCGALIPLPSGILPAEILLILAVPLLIEPVGSLALLDGATGFFVGAAIFVSGVFIV
jgi:hypothetical protein